MTFDPEQHHRRTIRLQGFDYATPGAYFVTICVHRRERLLGDITDGAMTISDAGRIVQDVWNGLPGHYLNVVLDEMVIMPNHIHGIVWLTEGVQEDQTAGSSQSVGTGFKPVLNVPRSVVRHGLPEIVRALRTFSGRRINQWRSTPGTAVWQQDYYEHIIRDTELLDRIREYVRGNPEAWEKDPENVTVD